VAAHRTLAAELRAAVRDAGRLRGRAGLFRGLAPGLALATLAAAASAALLGLAGWLIVRSAQTGLSATSTFSWIYPSAGVEALAVVRTAARYGERLVTHGTTLEMLARLRARVFASATRMAPRQLRRFHSGDLLDRVQSDIDTLDQVVLAVAVPVVVAAIVGAAGLTVLALIRPEFAAVNALALAVAVTGDLVVGRRSRRAGGELARTRAAARARLVEALDGRLEIAVYGAGPRALAELEERFRAADAPRRRWSAREGAGQLITDLAGAGALAAVLASGAGLGARPLSPAVLAFAALLTMTLFEVTGSLAAAGPALGQALAAWRRLGDTSGLGARQQPAGPPAAQPPPSWARGNVTLRGFVAGLGEEPALAIGALDLPAGGFTVITGASGVGKSTLLQVLAGALRPMAGSVRVGGTDPHALGYEDLVAGVTLMEQDSQLLSGTVADNLRLARPDASDDQLRAAMQVAVLDGQIDLAAKIAPGGAGLSGGQRRRLGVAQACLRRPGLLLLDEPTEGLDQRTARALLGNLRSALPGTTIIAAIHDRTLHHLPAAADATVRLAGRQAPRMEPLDHDADVSVYVTHETPAAGMHGPALRLCAVASPDRGEARRAAEDIH
jgi:ABC-type transport system involved in cytochrome bd biosynthesis fused ATPase/permease subunit